MHMAQRMPLPLTVSCFSRIQIGFTFLVPAHPGSPGEKAVKRVCVCVCVYTYMFKKTVLFIPQTRRNNALPRALTSCSKSRIGAKRRNVESCWDATRNGLRLSSCRCMWICRRRSVSTPRHSVSNRCCTPHDRHPSLCTVVRPTRSCFADWSKRRHVTFVIIEC